MYSCEGGVNIERMLNFWVPLVLVVSCGPSLQSENRPESSTAEDAMSPTRAQTGVAPDGQELGLGGLGDHTCTLTYQLVKLVTGMSSAGSFYETASGNLVSKQATLGTDFGDSCFTYCGMEFQRLKTLHGSEKVLVRSCSFNRQLQTADVKGMVEGYKDGVLTGWACKYGNESAVELNVFAGAPPGSNQLNKDPTTGAAIRVFANLPPRDSTDKANLIKECGTSATSTTNAAAHRFAFTVPQKFRGQYQEQPLFVFDLVKNHAIGNSGGVSLPPICPSGYVFVPASNVNGLGNSQATAGHPNWWLDTSKDFCVMKYPAKNNHSSTYATSTASGTPWVNIPRGVNDTSIGSAMKACKDAGPGYRLISNTQWQTVVRNAEAVPANWSGGAVGIGVLAKGHTDSDPPQILAHSFDSDPYFGTLNFSKSWSSNGATPAAGTEQIRTKKLSNGAVVWDFGGNVTQWVSDNFGELGMNPFISGCCYEYNNTVMFPLTSPMTNLLIFGPSVTYSQKNIGEIYGTRHGATPEALAMEALCNIIGIPKRLCRHWGNRHGLSPRRAECPESACNN